MGLRDKIAQGVSQSNCLQIELDPGFNPEKQFALPGTVLSGHVVVRNPQPLSIGELRITIYGISDATILRKLSTIRNYFYSRGFLFQEISVLLQGPVTLEPTQDGYRYPFSFTMPETTSPMRENEANFVYRFKPRPPFAGAQEMHTLPPSFSCEKKVLFGFHKSSVVYHLDVTCTKGPSGGSFWLPQTGSTFAFSPSRRVQTPDPRWQSVFSVHQLKFARSVRMCFHVPAVACTGSALPMRVSVEASDASTPIILTDLEVVLIGCSLTRARSILLGEKVAEDKVERPVAKLRNLAVSVGAADITLQDIGIGLDIPGNWNPCFSSFNISQSPYSMSIRYVIRVGTERVKGTITDRPLELLPGVYQPGKAS